MSRLAISFDHPWLLALSALAAVALALIARWRQPQLNQMTIALWAAGAIALLLATGGPIWSRPAASEIAVLVDLSPSTRTAEYRQRTRLEARIKQLLGQTAYRLIYFSDRNLDQVPQTPVLPDLAAPRTVYAPPAAPAVLLFSDGQFDLPASAPPTFIVADPALDDVTDAAVQRLDLRGRDVAATVVVAGKPRKLNFTGTVGAADVLPPGRLTLSRPVATNANTAVAQFDPGDPWPENDALSITTAPPAQSQRWLVSTSRSAPAGWRRLSPADLPTDPASYLGASVIALDNIPAASLSPAQQQRLAQYVRDLGGGLLIGGGDHAFAAGMYDGTILDRLSPLASSPPQPAVHWILLADASGSMAQESAGVTRLDIAASALVRLLPILPPQDLVTIGSFAKDLTWWSDGRSARETAQLNLPPPQLLASGPTNLATGLEQIATQSDGGVSIQLLVVSDTDTEIPDPQGLAARLKAKQIHLHVLALGTGRGTKALQQMTAATGGSFRTQSGDPRQWTREVRQMLASAWPDRLIRSPVAATFTGDLKSPPGRDVSPWNRTWLKNNAALLASADHHGEKVPLAARWTIQGQVIATAFTPASDELDAMSRLIQRPPRDPRFTITWDAGSRLRVAVDAKEKGRPLNRLRFALELPSESGTARSHELNQTAPGRYMAIIESPAAPAIAALRLDGAAIDRAAIPGHYPAEFDAIGNNYPAMRELAARTGGAVIDRAWHKKLDLPLPTRRVSLAPHLCILGAILLAAGLARWRWG